jgi:hypothetical protein
MTGERRDTWHTLGGNALIVTLLTSSANGKGAAEEEPVEDELQDTPGISSNIVDKNNPVGNEPEILSFVTDQPSTDEDVSNTHEIDEDVPLVAHNTLVCNPYPQLTTLFQEYNTPPVSAKNNNPQQEEITIEVAEESTRATEVIALPPH